MYAYILSHKPELQELGYTITKRRWLGPFKRVVISWKLTESDIDESN